MHWHDPPLRAGTMEVIADGAHDRVRWWLQRFEGVPGFAITLSGLDGGAYVAALAELPDADPATVEAWLVRTLAKARAGREGSAVRAAAKHAAAPPPPVATEPIQPARSSPWSGGGPHYGERVNRLGSDTFQPTLL